MCINHISSVPYTKHVLNTIVVISNNTKNKIINNIYFKQFVVTT